MSVKKDKFDRKIIKTRVIKMSIMLQMIAYIYRLVHWKMYDFMWSYLQLQGEIAYGLHRFQYLCFQRSENRFKNNGTKQI